jgi:hypothetical protein
VTHDAGHSPTGSEFTEPSNPDQAVRDEVASLLEVDDGLLGEVYRNVKAGMTDDAIREARGAAGVAFVWHYKRIIRALLDGDLPTAPSVAAKNASFFRRLLKNVDLSPATRQVLEARLEILESRAADPEAQAVEEKKALKATKEAEQHAVPGIYVYTLPHYLRHPYDSETGHTLLKVGHSGTSVIQRFNSQKRETVLPEEPVLLRVYPTDVAKSAEIEKQFHGLLDAADHLRREGRAVGREWFLTTTKFLDQIAATLGLKRQEVYDPDDLE